jgi:hypothetical protein
MRTLKNPSTLLELGIRMLTLLHLVMMCVCFKFVITFTSCFMYRMMAAFRGSSMFWGPSSTRAVAQVLGWKKTWKSWEVLPLSNIMNGQFFSFIWTDFHPSFSVLRQWKKIQSTNLTRHKKKIAHSLQWVKLQGGGHFYETLFQ